MPKREKKGAGFNFLFSLQYKSFKHALNKSISGKILNTNQNPSVICTIWSFIRITMSEQKLFDLINRKFADQEKNLEKNFLEVGRQLVQHGDTMAKMEKEITTRVNANTVQLDATIKKAASNSARVDAAEANISSLQEENVELKAKFKKFEANQLDLSRRNYKRLVKI